MLTRIYIGSQNGVTRQEEERVENKNPAEAGFNKQH
jgi:hypothetical protein